MKSKSRGENKEKVKIPPAREANDVWKKRKSVKNPTEKSKSRGENEEKVKIPPAREANDVWKSEKV